jgi:glycosyltransferase involved in cell wall biosynthesis
MVTRLLRSKGVGEFARAAASIRERNPSAQFLLVGAVDHGASDALNASELETLEQSVTLAGPRPDIAEILAVSDVFALPSKYREGMPRSILEAMSMSLPVVTTDIAGCRDAVEVGRSGFVVPPGDVAALASAIEQLIQDESLRRSFGRAARQRVIARFSLPGIAEMTAGLYRRLLAERVRGR